MTGRARLQPCRTWQPRQTRRKERCVEKRPVAWNPKRGGTTTFYDFGWRSASSTAIKCASERAALAAEVTMAAPQRGNTGYSCYLITGSTFQKRQPLQSDRMASLFVN